MVIGRGYCADESESAGLPCIFYALHHSVQDLCEHLNYRLTKKGWLKG